MSGRITRKWRPPLVLVLGGTLTAVFCLPLLGIGYFRVAGNILGWGETAWLIGMLAFVSTAVLAYFLWRLVLRPVQALTTYARVVARGQLPNDSPTHFGTPEFTALGQSVIDMGAALNDRAEGLRAYSDHVTHELKSPLTVLRGATELLDTPNLPEDQREILLEKIHGATQRMTQLLDAQRALARAQDPTEEGACQLANVVSGLVREYPKLTILLDGDYEVPLPTEALSMVLSHLFGNAEAHGASEVRVTLTAGALCIGDNGCGISDGNRARIFEPFFTTRRDAGGTGMGLSIVRRILAAHGATIALLPDGPGAVFEIRF